MPIVLDDATLEESAGEPALAAPACPTLRVPRGKPRRVGMKERAAMALATALNDVFGPREKRAFGILMYHRIAEEPIGRPKPTWNVRPRTLEQQLSGLIHRGWQAWPLAQVMECLRRDLRMPRKTFVVTFDDGYANVFTQAYPILTRLSIPATVFLATAYLDSTQPFPSDDWTAAGQPGVPSESWRPLTSNECVRLKANGLIELGAHTHSHADFRGQPDDLIEDLHQNLDVLRVRFGFRVARGLALQQVVAGDIPVTHACARGRTYHAVAHRELLDRYAELHPRTRQQQLARFRCGITKRHSHGDGNRDDRYNS